MTPVHFHLIITHLPVFGSILGAVVMLFAIVRKSGTARNAAYTLYVISVLGATGAYISGEPSEETAENIQGVNKNAIEEHEESATIALAAMIALGAASLAALFLGYKGRVIPNAGTVIFVISLISFAAVARTAWLGGKIRHTEISSSVPQGSGGEGIESGEDD